jgi:hypothetical protein
MSPSDPSSREAAAIAEAIAGHANVLAKNLVHLKTFIDELDKRQAAAVERANNAAVQSAAAAVASNRTAKWAMLAALLSALAALVEVGLYAIDRDSPVRVIVSEPMPLEPAPEPSGGPAPQ